MGKWTAPFSVMLLLLALPLRAEEPEPVLRLSRSEQKSQEWYATQALLWKDRVAADPTDAKAWSYYYIASEYAGRGRPEGETDQESHKILDKMADHVPDSYEYWSLRARQLPFQDSQKTSALERAVELCPDCDEALETLALIKTQQGDQAKAEDLWTRLHETGVIAPGLLDYNYNMLMSTEADAILITNGDNDTFPALLLQALHGIRSDVTILNLFLSFNYRDTLAMLLERRGIDLDVHKLPKDDSTSFLAELCAALDKSFGVPVYVALTVPTHRRDRMKDSLYLCGLATRFAGGGVDNMALLRRNLETRFRLDSLTHDWYGESHVSYKPVVVRLGANYSFPFMMLSEHYETSGNEPRARHWRQLALTMARKSGDQHLVDQLNARIAAAD